MKAPQTAATLSPALAALKKTRDEAEHKYLWAAGSPSPLQFHAERDREVAELREAFIKADDVYRAAVAAPDVAVAGTDRDATIEECAKLVERRMGPIETYNPGYREWMLCAQEIRAIKGSSAPVVEGHGRWIPVSERLPETGEPVLIYQGDASHTKRTAYYDRLIGDAVWVWTDRSYQHPCKPEAWMPIPPYHEGEAPSAVEHGAPK